jgi:uncharacterized protein YebE (UPF0316 family)
MDCICIKLYWISVVRMERVQRNQVKQLQNLKGYTFLLLSLSSISVFNYVVGLRLSWLEAFIYLFWNMAQI